MAKTFIQQSQISGSLSPLDNVANNQLVKANRSLTDDLNSLRTQVKQIMGTSAWTDELSGGQDLADIRAAVHMNGANASFQGAISSVGNAEVGGQLWVAAAAGLSGSLTVAGLSDLNGALDVAGIADFGSAVYMDAGLGVSGSLAVAQTADFGSTLDVVGDATFSADIAVMGDAAITSDLSVDGASWLQGALAVSGSFVLAGAADLNGALDVAGIADFSSAVYMDGFLGVSGSLEVAQSATFKNGATVNTAALDVNAGMTANEIKIDGDTAGRLYIVGAAGEIKDESSLSWGSSKLSITGGIDAGVADMDALYVSGPSGLSGSVTMAGGLTVNTVVADFNAGITANEIKIDSDVAQRLYIVGADGEIKDESKLTFDGSELRVDGAFRVTGNAQVDGDLLVKGSTTYIETTNLKVQDAFIHLATGSTGAQSSGIVLHGGAGAAADLMLAQDGGAGEFVFAKLLHSSPDHADVDGDNSVVIDGAELVSAWMSGVKLGSSEGSLSGSLAASAGGLALSSESGKEISISAASALKLAANGNAAVSFADAAQVPTGFTATSIVGMLNELRSDLDGGSIAKASYGVANFAGNVLSFADQATLGSADHKLVDVYLNGVLMAPTRDLTAISTTSVTFDASIVSSLIADDVIVVITRG